MELGHLLHDLGITAIFVTHDQDEALVMSDRIAVMHAGRIEQFDTPAAVYARPATPFVLDFVGMSTRLRGTVAAAAGDELVVTAPTGRVRGRAVGAALPVGAAVVAAVRPENVRVGGQGENSLELKVRDLVFLGSKLVLHCHAAEGDQVVAELPAGAVERLAPGDASRRAGRFGHDDPPAS
jgi:putative spermidine/putrescine transport system ATP-binding protein